MTKFIWEHIHLRSPDPAATAAWYQDNLGAEIIRTPQADGTARYDLDLTGQKIFIEGRPRRDRAIAADAVHGTGPLWPDGGGH